MNTLNITFHRETRTGFTKGAEKRERDGNEVKRLQQRSRQLLFNDLPRRESPGS